MTRGDVLRYALSFALRRERDRARPQGGLDRGRTLRPAERTIPRLRRRIGADSQRPSQPAKLPTISGTQAMR